MIRRRLRGGQAGQLGCAQVTKRSELAKIAVALHIHCQQRDRNARRISRFAFRVSKFVTRNTKFDIQSHADNRLNLLVLRFFVKRHRCVHSVGVRQRHGGHVLLDRGGDDFVRRRDASQERIVTVTMQVNKHKRPE